MHEPLSSGLLIWGPIAGIIGSSLWYMDAKDRTLPYMAEVRFLTALSAGIPAVLVGICTVASTCPIH